MSPIPADPKAFILLAILKKRKKNTKKGHRRETFLDKIFYHESGKAQFHNGDAETKQVRTGSR